MSWQYSTIHNTTCQVIEEQTLWGQTVCRIWLPNQNTITTVPKSALRPLNTDLDPKVTTSRISYIAAAGKIADVLYGSNQSFNEHVFLAPMESNVIPLPHQINALSRAISGDRVRYLLADEVGLGKTIEAGLIMRELKLRGLVRRTLVVAPKGIATQWAAEMQTHFNERFQLVLGEDIPTLQRLNAEYGYQSSAWSGFDQVVVSLDSVKPMDKRRGWTRERIAHYNRNRFEDLLTASWDLVIVDEAHRLGGSTDQVARYKLGRGLAQATPYVLLLSATPHQGKTDAFHRLMNLLDDVAFPDTESVSRDRVAPYVIRTEKRNAIDAEGKPLFKPRRTETAPVKWEARHHLQQTLYETVTDYVREGYNKALQQKQRHIGFLMILMQRLVVSSTRAIRTTLQRRLSAVNENERLANDSLTGVSADVENGADSDEFYDMDGQELLDELLRTRIAALQSEGAHVETLLAAAERCEQASPDAKAEALLEWIYRLQVEENEADLKVLVFTEFVPTQEMLKEFLEARGISVSTLNGSMSMDERACAQNAFRKHSRVLISTDAGGEGLNLQFCHIVINYDIPWNPMRLEQRIGRVDRIGQPRTVRAINFVFENSVEFRVRHILEQKLAVIFEEFGIDKTGDVLDSAQAGELFDDMFASAIVDPGSIEETAENAMARIRDEIRTTRESSPIYGLSEDPDMHTAERLRSHPLPHWIERMTVNYLQAHNGSARRKRSWWELTWPDGQTQRKCVFSSREAQRLTEATFINLEDSRIRNLALNLPLVAEGETLPCVSLPGLPATVDGLWGLFEIRLQTIVNVTCDSLRIPAIRKGYISIFMNEEGKLFQPTARHIWDSLQATEPQLLTSLGAEESKDAYCRLMTGAEHAGKDIFERLCQDHDAALCSEEERGRVLFASRRSAIECIGLAEVRQYRAARCEEEQKTWRESLSAARQIMPEIRPVLMMRLVSGGGL
ncbi:MAG: DEAD/DEAH box helicase [Chitinispirillaceae bacterium]